MGEDGRGISQLLAMAPMVKEGGCITLDWLVINDGLKRIVDADEVAVQAVTVEAETDL